MTLTEDKIHQLHKILSPKLLQRTVYLALQVETLLKHYQASNSARNTAKIMLRWAQKATGIARPVLEDKKRLPYLEGGWISNIRDGLITINAELKTTEPWITAPQQEHNQHLMEILCQDTQLTNIQVTQLNYCRLYLKVELLPNITTSDGQQLIPRIYQQQTEEQLDNQIYLER
eukprot:8058655-Ditylum_brightwellii.AAC.1